MPSVARKSRTVNCSDQSYGLATLGNLLGIHSTVVMTQPFGYINTVNLIGVGPCNNPFYTGPYTGIHIPAAGQDDTNRSAFGNHMYVFAEGVIFDACAGAELGTRGNVQYLKAVIDSSTMDEMKKSFFSPYDVPGLPRELSFETRNYTVR